MLAVIFSLFITISVAQEHEHGERAQKSSEKHSMGDPMTCGHMMVFDKTSASCIALPMEDMGIWMVHGNTFAVQSIQPKPRGLDRFSVPNMLMVSAGKSFGNNYWGVNLMLTAERWTFPKEGYPELLQIGERNEDGLPYIDAQHPHSSPITGLTLSDTMRLGNETDYVRVFLAPRGQATEGPVAFMHRSTGMVNPDAPLGHHIGQDVSHISSSVVGASISVGKTQFEISGFNGREPEPTASDLPLGEINSYATRLAYSFSENTYAMISAAEVSDPEPSDPTLTKLWRYSGSIYNKTSWESTWMLESSFVYGIINNFEHISALRSVLYEFWLHQKENPSNYWGRVESVQRTANQLAVGGTFNLDDPKWVYAVTAGYTHKFKIGSMLEVGIGTSVTKNMLPTDFQLSYGGEPFSGKVFFQISGMSQGIF